MVLVILFVLCIAGAGVALVARGSSKPSAQPPAPPRPAAPPVASDRATMVDIVREQRAFVDAEAKRLQDELAAALRQVELEGPHPADHSKPAPRPTAKAAKPKSGEWKPPAPAGVQLAPWSPRLTQFEVAGEYYRPQAFTTLFRRQHQSTSGDGGELRLPATLVPDPENPYDRNAVAVYVDGLHVGYLERGDAKNYHQPIAELTALGAAVTVRSRQWARSSGRQLFARVTLMLPETHGFQPVNALPDEPHVVLPVGGPVQVTKEDQHMDVLGEFVTGAEVSVAVTLHTIVETRPRSTVDLVEIRMDGKRIGVLSPTQTANLKPLVDYIAQRNRVPVARAVLVGNQLKADVTLYAAKAHNVDQAWLDALGPVAS